MSTSAAANGGSILETIGQEIIAVMSPVSICMFLVVLLITTTNTSTDSAATTTTIRTAANLVYLENPNDTTSQKLQGAILNAIVFVAIITAVTFLLVLLYYYRFTNFLIHYTRFSVFTIFSTMGGSILFSLVQKFNIPIDAPTCFVLLFNLTVLGTLSVFSNGVPILVKQGYMVLLGIIVAAWFTRLPEWTTWVVLVALALYDLVAVLAPGGPLKLLVELASTREEELPALVYESRPVVGRRNGGAGDSSLGALLAIGIGMSGGADSAGPSRGDGVELVQLSGENTHGDGIGMMRENDHMVIDIERNIDSSYSGDRSMMRGNGGEISGIEETSPLIQSTTSVLSNVGGSERNRRDNNEGERTEIVEENDDKGIKLGMGDFIFYSVLVGRAAMYDLMTVYACYLAIISGLGCTLVLLAIFRQALPALPISIALGVVFYFLTRLLMEPFVVGASTNLMMF